MSDVTQVLSQIEDGDGQAAEELLPLVYAELRKLAAEKMAHEKPGQTLQATALVHEAYIRLVDTEKAQHWNSRGHFFAAAAEAMRRILVERARHKRRVCHGEACRRVELDEATLLQSGRSEDLLALDEALARLARQAPTKAALVKLRYFAGLSLDESAEALGISLATAKRYWTYARAWLYSQLNPEENDRPS
jgi:RNA polymerase sigma factor (TIGR02999 family)